MTDTSVRWISGYLSRAHTGRYIFSHHPPIKAEVEDADIVALYPVAGDPWWSAPGDDICLASLRAYGLGPLAPLETIKVSVALRIDK